MQRIQVERDGGDADGRDAPDGMEGDVVEETDGEHEADEAEGPEDGGGDAPDADGVEDGGGDADGMEDGGDDAAARCGDGVVQDGEECDGDPARPCVTGCMSSGTRACGSDCRWSAECVPPAESCNGRDDDCDTVTDDGFPCARGSTVPCTTTCGSPGTGTCSDGCGFPPPAACVPPPESCNGLDDDCDTVADDGFLCTAGFGRACVVGPCAGTQVCRVPACTWGSCDLGRPSAGDICGPSAWDVSAGGSFRDSGCAAADDHVADCGGTIASGPDVYYRFSLAVPADAVLDTTGSAGDVMLFLYSGSSCGALEPVACDDDSAGGGQAAIAERLQPGPYWVVLDAAGSGSRGPLQLNVAFSPVPPPPNDDCGGAIDIAAGGTFSDQTWTASDDNILPVGCGGAGGRDVWFTFTLAEREVVYLDTVDGNDWNSVLEVRSGSCPAPTTSVACADDQCAGYSGGHRSQWLGTLDPGTYYVVVDGADSSAAGDFTLLFQHSACADAWLVSGDGSYSGMTLGETNHSAGSCGGTAAGDVRYAFGLCAAATVTTSTCNAETTFDSVLYLLSGGCGSSEEMACDDNDSGCPLGGGRSVVSATLPQGLNFLVVDGQGGSEGTYDVDVSGL